GEMQQIAQHDAFVGRQVAIVVDIAAIVGIVFMFADFFFQLLAQRGLMVPPKEKRSYALPYSAFSAVVGS
ncbi:hypothetical protein, partial [Sphingorhabdus sp.]|uniref:hypothetical protein n=1 Tax=Sphingorhabdus sp. TaxID=1902408 RepID=UPI003BB0D950